MENFELIEKYAAGQLQGPEKEAFELQLQNDTSLQGDVALQKQIIEGIRKARVSQLKAMLNQVPVTSALQFGTGVSTIQIVTGVITAGAVITGTLFYYKPWQKEIVTPVIENKLPSVQKDNEPEITPANPEEDKTSSTISEPNKDTKKKVPVTKKQSSVQPKIEVVDPTDELTQENSREREKLSQPRPTIITSRIAVEINSASIKYSFHYQFNQGKLILYGIFDSGLYEVLEVNGDTHSVFLYYKDNYYLLNEKQSAINPLVTIKDLELVKKLKEYRGR